MWTEYKKEIIAQHKQGRIDFLKTFYQHNLLSYGHSNAKDLKKSGGEEKPSLEISDGNISGKTSLASSLPSVPIVLDSDEEPPPEISEKKPPSTTNEVRDFSITWWKE